MLISTSKFFKDNKIARARRASAICSLWKIYKCLLHQIALELNHVITCIIFMKKKHHRKLRQTKFWKRARTLCSLYSGSSCNFDSSYIRLHSFSANQKREIFSCTLLNPKLSLIVRFFLGILSGGQCNVLCFNGGTCNKDNCTCKNGFTGKFCQSRM